MISRVFWIGIGIGVGVTLVNRAQRVVRSMAPDAVAARTAQGVGGFWRDVREGMRDREEQLNTALGLTEEDDER